MSRASDKTFVKPRWQIQETWDLDRYGCIFRVDQLKQSYRFHIVDVAVLQFDDEVEPDIFYPDMPSAELAAKAKIVHLMRCEPAFGVHDDNLRRRHDLTNKLVANLMKCSKGNWDECP